MDAGRAGDDLVVSLQPGSLTDRLILLLQTVPETADEQGYALGDLSLLLGLRLPDVAQTETYWHRGETGRAVRRLGFGVRVEFGRVIFVRRPSR